MEDLRKAARAFAIEAHGDQTYGDAPYVTHLDAVVALLDAHGHGDAAIAGYLHDVLEDTDTTRSELADEFGERVATAVAFCSDEPGPNRKARKSATYARMARDLATGGPGVTLGAVTKVADRLANVAASAATRPDLLEMYRGEHPTFREALHREGVCDSLWLALDTLMMI